MPRLSRIKSSTGLYHVLTRGINRQDIFMDVEDKTAYLERLEKYKSECLFQIYSYCLMSNHVHLLIREGEQQQPQTQQLPEIMKKINTSYAYWFNRKYNRVGHLFQDRYKSEPVENDRYLLTLVRYIHQNPVKIGYSISYWTSYEDFFSSSSLTDVAFVLELFSDDPTQAREQFKRYVNEKNDDMCMDISEVGRINDDKAGEIIRRAGNISNCQQLQDLGKTARNTLLRELKDNGLSIRQIERLTGINRGIVLNA